MTTQGIEAAASGDVEEDGDDDGEEGDLEMDAAVAEEMEGANDDAEEDDQDAETTAAEDTEDAEEEAEEEYEEEDEEQEEDEEEDQEEEQEETILLRLRNVNWRTLLPTIQMTQGLSMNPTMASQTKTIKSRKNNLPNAKSSRMKYSSPTQPSRQISRHMPRQQMARTLWVKRSTRNKRLPLRRLPHQESTFSP